MNDFLDRATADRLIGIDLGGTNLRAAAFDGLGALRRSRQEGGELTAEAYAPVAELREEVGGERAPEAIVARVKGAVDRLVSEAGWSGRVPVGIGFAGMLRGHDGFVANSPHLKWRDVPFGGLLRDALGSERPPFIYNDVNAITYGEFSVGAAVGGSDVLAVFVGTGIGGGFVCGGRLAEGADNCAGEIGHTKVVLGPNARACQCGLTGCVEAYAGGADLQRRARAELAGGARSKATELAGGAALVNPGHLDQAAAQGDEYALDLFAEIAPLLGAALANAVTLLNPSHLVLGGGVLSRTPILRDHVTAAFDIAVNPPAARSLEIVDAALGDSAGLVGSALLAARSVARQQ